MYAKYSAKEIKSLYAKQAKSVWKAVDMMINCEIKEGNDFIIEGHQIHPKLIAALTKKYGKQNICSLVITRFDINNIVEGCLKHKAKNDWFIQKTKDSKTYYKIAEMVKEYSNFFNKEAKKYKLSIVNVDTSFMSQINHSVRLLQRRLK
jgi:2-phosphoglycerate kinase